MNGDQAITVTDVGLFIKSAFFLPGDFVISLLLDAEAIAVFFELSSEHYQGGFSTFLSLVFWLSLYFFVRGLLRKLKSYKSSYSIASKEKRVKNTREKLGYIDKE